MSNAGEAGVGGRRPRLPEDRPSPCRSEDRSAVRCRFQLQSPQCRQNDDGHQEEGRADREERRTHPCVQGRVRVGEFKADPRRNAPSPPEVTPMTAPPTTVARYASRGVSRAMQCPTALVPKCYRGPGENGVVGRAKGLPRLDPEIGHSSSRSRSVRSTRVEGWSISR